MYRMAVVLLAIVLAAPAFASYPDRADARRPNVIQAEHLRQLRLENVQLRRERKFLKEYFLVDELVKLALIRPTCACYKQQASRSLARTQPDQVGLPFQNVKST